MIKPPRAGAEPPDRFLECQEALEDRIAALVEDAIASGWTEGEICAAMIEVAENRQLERLENQRMDDILSRALAWWRL